MTLHRAAAQDHNGDEVRARTWSWASNVTTWLSIAVAGMIIVFIGLAIDAWRHNNGAEEESLLSLSNPGHLVAGIGLFVTSLAVLVGLTVSLFANVTTSREAIRRFVPATAAWVGVAVAASASPKWRSTPSAALPGPIRSTRGAQSRNSS